MADKLLPCPFCGGEAEVFCACNASPYFTTFRTYCIDCGINIQADSEEEAVEKWNNRPSPWHTGTPTEDGWYLLHYPKSKEQPYELAQWNGEHFVAVKPFHAIIVRIEASSVPYWQKIEED